MRVYLDSCALSRPYDEYLNDEIFKEARAVEDIFKLIDSGELTLVDSRVLEFEAQAIRNEEKREKVNAARAKAELYAELTPDVKRRALELGGYGIKPMDALQLASAEKVVDVFITTDKRLLKKARRVPNLRVEVFSPIEFWRYYASRRG